MNFISVDYELYYCLFGILDPKRPPPMILEKSVFIENVFNVEPSKCEKKIVEKIMYT